MGILDNLTKWQNYGHYVLLALGVYLWHSIPFNEVVEQYYLTVPVMGFLGLLLWWTIGLFIIDTFIHFLFYIAPPPIQWRD